MSSGATPSSRSATPIHVGIGLYLPLSDWGISSTLSMLCRYVGGPTEPLRGLLSYVGDDVAFPQKQYDALVAPMGCAPLCLLVLSSLQDPMPYPQLC